MNLISDQTITMSIDQVRRHWHQILGQVEEHGLRVVITSRGKPITALVPFKPTPKSAIIILKQGVPIARLVGVKLDQDLSPT